MKALRPMRFSKDPSRGFARGYAFFAPKAVAALIAAALILSADGQALAAGLAALSSRVKMSAPSAAAAAAGSSAIGTGALPALSLNLAPLSLPTLNAPASPLGFTAAPSAAPTALASAASHSRSAAIAPALTQAAPQSRLPLAAASPRVLKAQEPAFPEQAQGRSRTNLATLTETVRALKNGPAPALALHELFGERGLKDSGTAMPAPAAQSFGFAHNEPAGAQDFSGLEPSRSGPDTPSKTSTVPDIVPATANSAAEKSNKGYLGIALSAAMTLAAAAIFLFDFAPLTAFIASKDATSYFSWAFITNPSTAVAWSAAAVIAGAALAAIKFLLKRRPQTPAPSTDSPRTNNAALRWRIVGEFTAIAAAASIFIYMTDGFTGTDRAVSHFLAAAAGVAALAFSWKRISKQNKPIAGTWFERTKKAFWMTLPFTLLSASIIWQWGKLMPLFVPGVGILQTFLLYLAWAAIQEIVFLGYFMNRINTLTDKREMKWLGLAIYASGFSFAHISYPELMAPTFLMALFWGWVYTKTRSLLPIILSHAVLGTMFLRLVLGLNIWPLS